MTDFNIEDCPKLVDDEFFYLANKPGTPLLRKNAIFRGSDMLTVDGKRIFEGDILRAMDGGEIYIVQFYNGFKLRSNDGSICPLGHRLIHHDFSAKIDPVSMPQWPESYFKTPKHSKLRYMDFSRNITFNLFDIICASVENALIYKNGGKVVAFRDIGQFSGIKHPSGKGYYYGQHIKGLGIVTLMSGNPGILTSEGFKSFGNAGFRQILEHT